MKSAHYLSSVEILEARIAPATISIAGGVATYTAAAGEFNTVDLRIEAGNHYRLSDGPNITLGAGTAGVVSGGGPGVVTFSINSVVGLVFLLGDQNDTLNVQGLADQLTYDGGAGSDQFTTSSFSGAITLSANSGPISIDAETINLSASSPTPITNASTITFKTDNLAIGASISASASISIVPSTAGREFDLGSQNGSRISLDAAETSRLIAPSVVIGNASSGGIFNTAAVDFGTASVALTAGSGSSISQTGGGAITAGGLSIQATTAVALNGANNVGNLAAQVTGGNSFAFTDATGFQINGTGLSASAITLNAGAVTQSLGANIVANSLTLSGAGPFTLTNAGNDVATLAANITGELSFTDANALASNGEVQTANADITLTADSLAIAAAVDAGTANVTLAPRVAATAINLGGADAAGTLGLTEAELSLVTAGTLVIGSGNTSAITVSDAITPAGVTNGLRLNGASVGGPGYVETPTLTVDVAGGSFSLGGSNDVNYLVFASDPGTSVGFPDVDGFTLGDPNGASTFHALGNVIAAFNVDTGTFALPSNTTLVLDINGLDAGLDNDALSINGTVNLGGAKLTLNHGPSVPAGFEIPLIFNDGTDAVTGTFDGLDEGDAIPGFSPAARITYVGGDGNDVAIITADPITPGVGGKGKSLFFRDVDGDFVTVTTSLGTFTGTEISGVLTGGANGEGRFEKLTLGAGFAGANITITASPSPEGGNGFVNLGFLDATGVDLGNVSIAGDLARLSAGSVGGDVKVPALKSLTVQSLGLLGASTLGAADAGTLGLQLEGALPKLTVKNDLRAPIELLGAADGKLGTVTVGGSIVGAVIVTPAGIGLIKVGGDLRATPANGLVIATGGVLGGLTVDGSIVGSSSAGVGIRAFGALTALEKGTDIAIKSVIVKGSVERAFIFAGQGIAPGFNADASIGSISVGGDWIASSVAAGVLKGADNFLGTNDDVKFGIGSRDDADIVASIGSFTVKGQAYGSATAGDMFGIVAEQIGKAKVGKRTFAFTKTGDEAFFAAPNGPGAGAENPAFDFTIREIGAATPAGTITGGVAFTLSADMKTATFNDVDGDLVTVKRTLGTFAAGDFNIAPVSTGGGQFNSLTLTTAPGNLTITAKPGPDGGNGFVNITTINATNLNLGAVSIAGDLGALTAGQVGAKPGVKSLALHSSGQTGAGGTFAIAGDLGKLSVTTAVRDTAVQVGGALGSATLGGSLIDARISGSAGIGAVKIGGSVLGGRLEGGAGAIGAIGIGGDLVGDGTENSIVAFGALTAPAKGTDLAIKSLAVGGSIENARILAGSDGTNSNADASIGAITVGKAWLASTATAGTRAGVDTFFGTGDDTKISGGTVRDTAAIFSQIASITIKGQALGSVAAGDSFGIVAELISAAKIGTVKLKLDKGERDATDAFALAPTGPGATGLASDFFLREITG